MFGATTAAFGASTPVFGAVSPAPSLFGATTPAFGASPAPGFGAASTPAFGGNAPTFGASSTPAFGAQSTPAFGASSTPLFGAQSTPAFGASSTPLFGGQSTPAFGAQSTPAFGAFGVTSTPAFGASSTPAFGASSTPAFGAAFGAVSSAASTPSLFGATPAAPFSFNTTPGAFAATSTPQTGIFGSSQPAQGNFLGALAPPAGPSSFAAAPAQPDFSAVREVVAIRDAYVPDNDKFRFQSLFLNVIPDAASRVKPPGVDDLRWREALQRCGGAHNPDNLWPVPARGFKDLLARKDAQDAAMSEHAQRLAALLDTARNLARRQDGAVRERMDGIKRRHIQLSHALLRLMRRLDGVESRIAVALNNGDGAAAAQQHRKLQEQLQRLHDAVLMPSASGLQRHVGSLVAAAHVRGAVPSGAYSFQANGSNGLSIDAAGLAEAFDVLKQHTVALQKLQDVLAKDEQDLAIITQGDQDSLVTFRPVV